MSTLSSSGCLKVLHNGEFEIIKIDEGWYDEAVELFLDNFVKYENLAIACQLDGSEQTRREMEFLLRSKLRDNMSFAARHIKTNQLAAVCINKIEYPKEKLRTSNDYDSLESPNMAKIVEILEFMERQYDIYREWEMDYAVELVFLCTKIEFCRKGLALALANYTIDFVRQMPSNRLPNPLRHLKPKAIFSIFSSYYSQRIGDKLGFRILAQVPYEHFSFQGKQFSEILDPIHKFITYAALEL